MYARQPPDRRPPFRIPGNYSGNAFSKKEESPPCEETPETVEAPAPTEESPPPSEPAAQPTSSLSRLFGHSEQSMGIGTEELLLLGILLILSQSDEGGDILPFLLILLFLKSGK